MNILITGGLGHIGSYVLENIRKIKNIKKIYIIDNLSTQRFYHQYCLVPLRF